MEKLLQFVDNFTLDPHLYYRISGYEIMWVRQGNQTWWKFCRENTGLWTFASRADIVSALQAVGVDIAAFEAQVTNSIAYQAVFADMVLEKAAEAISIYAVEAAVAENREFTKNLVAAVKQLTGPKLRLV